MSPCGLSETQVQQNRDLWQRDPRRQLRGDTLRQRSHEHNSGFVNPVTTGSSGGGPGMGQGPLAVRRGAAGAAARAGGGGGVSPVLRLQRRCVFCTCGACMRGRSGHQFCARLGRCDEHAHRMQQNAVISLPEGSEVTSSVQRGSLACCMSGS